MTTEEKIRLLAQKLTLLSANIDKQKSDIEMISKQINSLIAGIEDQKLKAEISSITENIQKPVVNPDVVRKIEEIKETKEPVVEKKEIPQQKQEPVLEIKQEQTNIPFKQQTQQITPKPAKKINVEQYIGVKLAGIIGIIVLVIGVSMGVKYAIDNDLINPLTRIIFGFLSGGILLTVAFILKKKYHLFSAVLLGGAVSIMFFSAFAGNAFYELYPKGFAFGLMFIITAFTVFAAHSYNYEVIAVIGLVGAYAIPPLLSDGSGHIAYMFTYMAIINTGILILSLFKNWRWVKYFAYGLTWIITSSWIIAKYQPQDLKMAMPFLSVFFLTFYTVFIGYKLIRKLPFEVMDIITLLSNSFIYFGLGYYLLNNEYKEMYLGLFCVFNAIIHSGVAYLAFARKATDKNILYFLLALVFTYVTIAIPVQLEGAVVSLAWFAEMLALYFIGRKYNVPFYKYISYAVALMGFFSLWHVWAVNYMLPLDKNEMLMSGIFNKVLLTALFGVAALGGLWFLFAGEKEQEGGKPDVMKPVMKVFIPVFFYVLLYFTVFFEIVHYFTAWEQATAIKTGDAEYYYDIKDRSVTSFMFLWILIFNALFMAVNLFISSKFLKSKPLNWAFYGLSIFALLLLIPAGLAMLGELRNMFNTFSESVFPSQFRTPWLINFRYVFLCFGFGTLLLIYFAQRFMQNKIGNSIYIWIMHLGFIALLSSELVNQFRLSHPEDAILYDKIARRMGFTILWALYSLTLIVVGIAKRMKMLRVMGFVLFGISLLKLLVDSFNMSGSYKIIVWISLGIILILTGFLYQKFKHILFDDDETKK